MTDPNPVDLDGLLSALPGNVDPYFRAGYESAVSDVRQALARRAPGVSDWLSLNDAPLDVYGHVWSPNMPDRVDFQGRVGAYADGGRTVYSRDCQGVNFTHWRAFPKPPALGGRHD